MGRQKKSRDREERKHSEIGLYTGESRELKVLLLKVTYAAGWGTTEWDKRLHQCSL